MVGLTGLAAQDYLTCRAISKVAELASFAGVFGMLRLADEELIGLSSQWTG
jgi:hypothetical protein